MAGFDRCRRHPSEPRDGCEGCDRLAEDLAEREADRAMDDDGARAYERELDYNLNGGW